MACNCVHGTAREDANGNCFCDDAPTTKENCEGVWIDGVGCTGGIKPVRGGGIVTVNEPLPDIYGQKPVKGKPCAIGAPNGYHYILNSAGECVLAVKYDYDTTRFNNGGGSNNNTGGLLDGTGLGDLIANNKGLIGLAIAAGALFFLFGRDKDGTATSRTVISRRGIR